MAEIRTTPHQDQDSFYALQVRQLERVYGNKGNITHALSGISFDVEKGEFVAIMGPSGSGKTTLLNCIATIDKPTSGSVVVGGVCTTRLSKRQITRFRREDLGFIFQDSNLIETLTGYENIALSLSICGWSASQASITIKGVADLLNITEVLDKFPAQMSGGQRQRVAAARAIVGSPKLILADEPTGALDSHNATVMLETMERINQSMGATILMVTHDAYVASWASRVLFVKDGKLFTELYCGEQSRKEMFSRIMEVQALLGGGVSEVQ